MVGKTKLYIIWFAALGKGLSGGDNILIELARRWTDKFDIIICTGKEGVEAANKKNLHGFKFITVYSKLRWFRYGERLWRALRFGWRFEEFWSVVYTASDFPHDVLVGWLIKFFDSSIKWIAGCYLIAPFPLAKHSPYKGLARIRGLGYWLMQRFTLPLIKRWADVVFVTSVPDVKYFPNKKVVIVKGGVTIPEDKPIDIIDYDAMFMGRFHYQKGVMELVDIWSIVVRHIPGAKLLMVGDGALLHKCMDKVIDMKLSKNISFLPFISDDEKDYLFRRIKIMVHPATYDSGGMSAAEGMAYGLPCVGFDLPVFKTYYARGMFRSKENGEFAANIIRLLTNDELYHDIAQEAKDYIRDEWDWDKRSQQILEKIL